MKKLLLILLATVVAFMPGCKSSGENASANLFVKISENEKINGDFFVYTQAYDISGEGYISEENLSFLYYGKYEKLPEISCIQNFCIALDKSKSCREIHIFKVKNDSDVFCVERMLECRGKYLCKVQINPGESEFFTLPPTDYTFSHKGKFVLMCIGENSEKILKTLERTI